MRRVLRAILGAVCGYLIFAVTGVRLTRLAVRAFVSVPTSRRGWMR